MRSFKPVLVAAVGFAITGGILYAARARGIAEFEARPLTVRQTLGSVFTSPHGGNGDLLGAANPAALPALRQLIANGETGEYRANIMTVFGSIGDSSDARRIEVCIRSTVEGRVSDREKGLLRFEGLLALARQSNRGIADATDILRAMTDPAYWKGPRFDSLTDTQEMIVDLEMAFEVYYGAAKDPDFSDFDARVKAAANAVGVYAEKREQLRALLSGLRRHEGMVVKQSSGPPPELRGISQETRDMLDRRFNGDMDHPRAVEP